MYLHVKNKLLYIWKHNLLHSRSFEIKVMHVWIVVFQLTLQHVIEISKRLDSDSFPKLASNLDIEESSINPKLLNDLGKSSVQEVAEESLMIWLKKQECRKRAYWKMGGALIKSDLTLIAREVLHFPVQQWTILNQMLSNEHIEMISKQLTKRELIRLAERVRHQHIPATSSPWLQWTCWCCWLTWC